MKGDHKMKISHRSSNRECGARGFSLLEMMIVICVLMIVGGIGFMALQPALKDAKVNQAFESAMMPLRVARQRAIAERKQYIVCYGIAAPPPLLRRSRRPRKASRYSAGMSARPVRSHAGHRCHFAHRH